ncbi:16S rRNA (uracil(1498)-N(3))-methyltransferase [Cytobacillus sp. FSL R5-0569]|uniref:16S rRNA (uracil(1498)-N(3))-methyltransferase n=1 Tax=Cytobacillus sp. FSL R5-0569 TaxID=2921649 RepID=UPI0030FA65C3
MQRYFVNHRENDHFFITGDDYHHITRVMRMNVGDEIICVDPDGKAAQCKLVNITSEVVELEVVQWIEKNVELPVDVTIVSGLPKGDKLEWIIQKGTELGAHQFIPFMSARSIVKLDEKKANKKKDRWQKIAKEAAEQSHRIIVPHVYGPQSLQQLLEISKNYDYKCVAYEESSKQGESSAFHQVLKGMSRGDSLLFIFGPEGGLTEKEITLLEDEGFISCGLGPRILRTETAPSYVLSAVSYHFELME